MKIDLEKVMKEQFDIMAAQMDARDAYFLYLKNFAETHTYEEIPEEHRAHLEQANSYVSWREQKKVVNRIKRASLVAAKNKLGLRKKPKKLREYEAERKKVAEKVGLA